MFKNEITESIRDFFEHMEEFSDKELFDNLKSKYATIIFEIYTRRQKYHSVLLNSRFVSVLYQVLYSTNIENYTKEYLNSLMYYTILNLLPNYYIRGLYFMLGELINADIVKKLNSVSVIDKELAIFLAIANQSTSDKLEAVSRVHFAISTSVSTVVPVSELRLIFLILYQNSVYSLILGTVFDKTINKGIEKEEEWVTDTVIRTTENIRYTVLYIMESMEPSEIANAMRLINDENRKRYFSGQAFEFGSLNPMTFNKISIIRKQLEDEEIYIG